MSNCFSNLSGFIFQQYNLIPSIDAAANAAVPLIAKGMAIEPARRKAMELLDALKSEGLSERATSQPPELNNPRTTFELPPSAGAVHGALLAEAALAAETALTEANNINDNLNITNINCSFP